MGKILIVGNPSSGTTFMVGLLTRLGLDTGYTEEEIEGSYRGLEIMSGRKSKRRERRRMWREEGIDISPQVIKYPFSKEEVPHVLVWKEQLGWEVERAIIMIRDIDVVIQHRKNHARAFNVSHHDTQLRLLLHEATVNEWELHFIDFPRAAQDVEYCWKVLQPLSGEFEQFKAAWERHIVPEEIHP